MKISREIINNLTNEILEDLDVSLSRKTEAWEIISKVLRKYICSIWVDYQIDERAMHPSINPGYLSHMNHAAFMNIADEIYKRGLFETETIKNNMMDRTKYRVLIIVDPEVNPDKNGLQ